MVFASFLWKVTFLETLNCSNPEICMYLLLSVCPFAVQKNDKSFALELALIQVIQGLNYFYFLLWVGDLICEIFFVFLL